MAIEIYLQKPGADLEFYERLNDLGEMPPDATLWVDIIGNENEELVKVAERFSLHELTIEDALDQRHSPKLEDFGRYLFMIFRSLKSWPEIEEEKARHGTEEDGDEYYTSTIALYLADKFLITFRAKEVAWLEATWRQVRQMPERTINAGADILAHRVIDVLIDRFLRGLAYFENEIDKIEDVVLDSPDDFDLSDLLRLKREINSLRHIMRDQKTVISRLAHERELIDQQQLRRYFRDIEDHAAAVIAILDKHIETLAGVRDVYFAMANVRLGDIMRILAVITTIGVPLNLVVGMYGMNFDRIPLLHDPHGFGLIVVLMVLLAILMLLFFRRNRWI